MNEVCRPKKLTCRWLREITGVIDTICRHNGMNNIGYIAYCNEDNTGKIWETYLKNLHASKCYSNSTVQDILYYRVDYNDVKGTVGK